MPPCPMDTEYLDNGRYAADFAEPRFVNPFSDLKRRTRFPLGFLAHDEEEEGETDPRKDAC